MKIIRSLLLNFICIFLWNCTDAGNNPINIDCPESNLDCAGICDGDATEDACGVCNGTNSTCNISYEMTIQPLLNENCTGCHGGNGGLTLTSYNNLMAGNSNNGPVIISGDALESLLIQKLKGTAISGVQMPKNGPYLDETTIELIESWIDEGALDN